MTELKTLKDCKIDNDDKCYIGQVKQEAIKHFKEIEEIRPLPKIKKLPTGNILKLPKKINELDFEGEKIEVSDKELIKCMKVLNGWIKYFFNIEECDLK